jgi:hypothetical protein
MRLARGGSAAVLALALTACGTTVSVGTGQQPGLSLGSNSEASAPLAGGGPAVTSSASPGPFADVVAPSLSPTADGQGPGQTDPGSTAPTSGTGPVSGVGFTRTTADLGISYVQGGDQLFASAGFNIGTGDAKALANALIKRLNASGGILGRTIVPVFHGVSAASAAADPASTDQAMCTAFTQDAKVFAVVLGADCLTVKHVPWARTSSQIASDRQTFTAAAPYLYDPNIMDTDDEIPLQLDRAVAHGFITPKSKIGLYYPDTPQDGRIAKAYAKALESRGLKVAATYANSNVTNANGAVLSMRAAGVDRVISWTGGTAYFMISADNQGYRPKYLLNTYLNLTSVMEVVPPKAQLSGSFGIGWQPPNDVDSASAIARPGKALCDKALADSGQANPQGSVAFILYSYCDSIELFVLGARAGGSLTPQGIRAGITKLGADFPTALNFESAYGLGRYSGALAARDIAFDGGCGCFKYQGTALHRP